MDAYGLNLNIGKCRLVYLCITNLESIDRSIERERERERIRKQDKDISK